jgi:hypothetical protein
MNKDLIDLIQSIVRDQLQGYRTAELGVVTNVYSHENSSDKNNYECDVRLRDSGFELKRVALCTQRVGVVAIPNPDDLVLVQYLNGDIHTAVIAGRLYNDQIRSPEAKAREYVYISQDSEESGIRRIYLVLPNSNKLTVDDDKVLLEMGSTKITVNNDGDIELNCASNNIKLTDGNGSNLLEIQSESGQVKVKGQTKVVVEAPQIEVVEGAMHPLVFGDSLVQYLTQLTSLYQSHLHPGQMAGPVPVAPAPPVPPIQPPTPDILSMKVKTG